MKNRDLDIVVLLVNIGEIEHHFLKKKDALRALGGIRPTKWVRLEQRVEYAAMSARDWRGIARDLDAVVRTARKAGAKAASGVRYVVMGKAPLPVFAYLGQQLRHVSGELVFLNQRQGEEVWDRVGPFGALPRDGKDVFEVIPPTAPEGSHGRMVISVRCSEEHFHPEPGIGRYIASDGGSLLGTFDIHYRKNHRLHPLSEEHLIPLLDHVGKALALFGDKTWACDGLVLTIAGPAWVAFWVGVFLNPRVSYRIDIPNFVPKIGYVHALASPIYAAPRLDGRARIAFFASEPADQGRLSPGQACERVRAALQRGQGKKGPYDLSYEGALPLHALSRMLQEGAPHILHLWLHGNPQGTLYLEDEDGNAIRLDGDDFLALMRRSRVRPSLIVISACYLATLADRLLEVAECVIAMKTSVRTVAAIAFAEGLYDELGRGRWVADAIAEGRLRAASACPKRPGERCTAEDCARRPEEDACPKSDDMIYVAYAKDSAGGAYSLLPARRRQQP